MKTIAQIRTHVAGREGDPPVIANLTTAEVRALLAELDEAVGALRDAASYLRGRANHETDFDGDHDAADRAAAILARHEAKPDARCTRDTGCGETPCICDPSKADA